MDDLSDGRARKRKQLSHESNSQSSGSPHRASFDKDKRLRRQRSASSGSSNGSRSPLAQVRRPMRGGRNGANPQGFDRRPRNFQNGDNNHFRRNDNRPFQQRNPQGRFPPNRNFDNQRFNRFDNRNGRNFPQRRDNQFGQRNFGDRNRNMRTWDQPGDNRRFPNQRPQGGNWNRNDRGSFNRRPQDRNRFATGDRWKQDSSNERYGQDRSPMRSPSRSPSRSPQRSPQRSPERSPYHSPHRSPIRSPPRKSPPRSIDLVRMKEDRMAKDQKNYEDRGKVEKAPLLPPEPVRKKFQDTKLLLPDLNILKPAPDKKKKKKKSPSPTSSSSSSESSSSSDSDSSDSDDSSDDSSSSSSSSSSEDEKKKKKKKKLAKKLKKKEKKRKKKKKKKLKKKLAKKRSSTGEDKKIPVKLDNAPDRLLSDISLEQSARSKAMAPISKKDWDKRQTVIRRIYDEASGRHRLIKGDGEVVEEIVSRDRHKQINAQATRADGEYFQSHLRKK